MFRIALLSLDKILHKEGFRRINILFIFYSAFNFTLFIRKSGSFVVKLLLA